MNEKAMAMIDSAIEALEANSTSAPVVEILKAAKAALPPLRAREEIAAMIGSAIEALEANSTSAPVVEILKAAAAILSSTAGQEWRAEARELLERYASIQPADRTPLLSDMAACLRDAATDGSEVIGCRH